MRLFVAALLFLLAALLFPFRPVGAGARTEKLPSGRESLDPVSSLSLITAYHGDGATETISRASRTDQGGGIKEIVPLNYKGRYEKWKKEFLATEAGRAEWDSYTHNPDFTLTIEVSGTNSKGGTTGKYKWNAAGQLIAATITLGTQIDEGFPNPIYFPVMSSLTVPEVTYRMGNNVLAAAKIAHEFGHVLRTSRVDATLYQRQTQLIPLYNKIFLSNGRNADDPRLLDLTKQIGGTPVEIWEDREYWGETNAMRYLRDRFADDGLRCALFSRIKYSIDLYARPYEERFKEIAGSSGRGNCGWQ
jgi:YD repeat-containing protein